MTGKQKRVAIVELLADDETAVFFDGLEDAIIGLSELSPGRSDRLVVYDYGQMIRVLVKRDKMDYDEAVEFLEFNTLGAWVGPQTPIVVTRIGTPR